jgi:hypothetical protein
LASINEKNLKLGDKRKFQLVLVGYDRNEKANKGYLKDNKLSWPGVKLPDKGALKKLTSKGETGFLPNLVMLKPDGTMVTNDRAKVLKELTKLASGS